jgi:non-specific serine/threonine protein kinase
MLLGAIESLSERTGYQPFAYVQASLHALQARARDELGPSMQAAQEAGRILGRSDQITAALWPAQVRKPAPAAASTSPLLTRREREVAELIARGLTNRQIGARLFIAERTVDTHVGHILAKLDCATRAQVAAIVTAGGAVTTATPPADPGPAVGW